jgi:hypothetical protein
MTSWQAVLTAALIGTERAVVPPPPPGFPTSEKPAETDPAGALLDQAALLTVARRAGRRPDHAELPPAADQDPRPMVSPAATRRLARILAGDAVPGTSGGGSDLLAEWLTAVAVRGLRLPPRYLPALLDRARRSASSNPDPEEARLRGLLAITGGSRARWLAGLNPAWAYLLAEPVPAHVQVPQYLSAEALADLLTKAMRELTQTPLTASRLIRTLGRRADPALGAPGALADFPPEAPNTLHAMLAVLRFRYEMLKELDDADS